MSSKRSASSCTHASSFRRFLKQYQGRPVFFEPLSGNNGDRLITLGAERLFRATGVIRCPLPSEAELIVINGGGAMNDLWLGGLIKLRDYCVGYPRTPIVVGPSSYRFQGIRLSDFALPRQGSVVLFAREMYSYRELKRQSLLPGWEFRHSQDVALELREAPLITVLRSQATDDYILAAMRKDKEGGESLVNSIRGDWLPRYLRTPLSKLRDKIVYRSKRGILDSIKKAETVEGPIIARDISVSVAFDEFLSAVTHASLVVTDRLHVAILAHMLKKRTYLLAGNYHKNRGVYEYSLDSVNGTVQFFEDDGKEGP